MESKGFHRKLTAILSADVGGYSRLMQDDEAATVRTLEAYSRNFPISSSNTAAGWWTRPGTTCWPSSPASWMRFSVSSSCRRNCRPAMLSFPRTEG